MYSTDRAFQIISIQHELAMNIGLNLDLEAMLKAFMQRAQQRLSLRSVAVIVFNQNEYRAEQNSIAEKEICYSYPQIEEKQKDWIINQAKIFFDSQQVPYGHIQQQSHHYYLLTIPQFGVLILERKLQPIDKMILASLVPLLVKLATSCQACQEHQNLIEEIEARKRAEELLINQSMIDPLTGLANRKKFNINFLKTLSENLTSNKLGAIFIFDLDRFKVINNTLGHYVGDEVIKMVGHRLQKCVGPGDTLARLGGDEFVLMVVDLSPNMQFAIEKAKTIAETISTLITEPIHVDKNVFSISNSTGINLFPVKEDSKLTLIQQSDAIVKNADMAMHSVKKANRNGYNFFNLELQSFSERKIQIEKCLKKAIQNNEFTINYQPLVEASGKMIGAEALLRWSNRELGQVSPADFIPVAEESGLILEIGTWVIEQVCQLLKSISDKQQSLKYISVNVSPRQFIHHDFADNLTAIIKHYNIDSHRIRIEVTEGVVIDNIDLTIQKIQKLKEHGVVTMLDDFGSGYSSLSYLHQLPLQAIKIDRSFISDIDASGNNRVIVDSIIDICEHFSLECIVEGVEHMGEFEYLSTRKITAYQGYYFYRPMVEKSFIELLERS